MQRAIYEQLRQYPGQEKQILEFLSSQPGAAASIRAPIFEEKVIDHLLTELDVTDKKVTKEELLADEYKGVGANDSEVELDPDLSVSSILEDPIDGETERWLAETINELNLKSQSLASSIDATYERVIETVEKLRQTEHQI